MAGEGPARLRNVAVVGHGGVGKTSLVERLLHAAGVIQRVGRVEDGSTASDWDEEEIRRGISLQTSVLPVPWQGKKINLLDTPGYLDFVAEVKAALRVVEGALVVVCGSSGVEVGTELAWQYLEECGLPRLFFINKMDRDNASFHRTLDQLRESFGERIVALQVPLGEAAGYRGVVDLLSMQVFRVDQEGPQAIPADGAEEAESWRESLIEAIVATDDELTMKYLEDEPLSLEEITDALHRAVASGTLCPVLAGSALAGAHWTGLLQYLVDLVPSPSEREAIPARRAEGEAARLKPSDGPPAALVFKTMADPYVGRVTLFRVFSGVVRSDSTLYNATKGVEERVGQLFVVRGREHIPVPEVAAGDIGGVAKLQKTTTGDTLCRSDQPLLLDPPEVPEGVLRLAIEPKAKGDEEKLAAALARIAEADPSITVIRDAEMGQTLVAGMGETHLEVLVSRLENKFGIPVTLSDPRIPFRETLRGSAKVEGKYKKQTGGRGQYGHVWLELEPLEPGGGFEFVDKIFGGAVPRQYIPAVEKGVQETMAEGVLAGYPVVDVRVTLFDGSYHSVDSSDMAFKLAASMAFRKGFMQANPVLLEPILQLEVVVPEAYTGEVSGDLNRRRGRIVAMDSHKGKQRIEALVPMVEMARYATALRSITQGRGTFKTRFSHYEEMPAALAQAIVAASGKVQAS